MIQQYTMVNTFMRSLYVAREMHSNLWHYYSKARRKKLALEWATIVQTFDAREIKIKSHDLREEENQSGEQNHQAPK